MTTSIGVSLTTNRYVPGAAAAGGVTVQVARSDWPGPSSGVVTGSAGSIVQPAGAPVPPSTTRSKSGPYAPSLYSRSVFAPSCNGTLTVSGSGTSKLVPVNESSTPGPSLTLRNSERVPLVAA